MDRPQEGSSRRAISQGRTLKHKDGEEAAGRRPSSAAAPRGAALAHSGAHRRRAGHPKRVNNPFDDPSSEIATPFDDPTPTGPDRWVQKEFEVETGRVVHQETIEGEPPPTLNPGPSWGMT